MGLMDSVASVLPTADATPQSQPTTPPDNGATAFNFFVGQGLQPHQAAGIVGNLQGESGQGLNPNAVSKGDGRDGTDSIGIGQWNGTRAQALKDYAASKGTNWNDLSTQLEFLHSELQGPEKRAYQALQAAQTPEDAARAFLGYERPKDWNVAGSHPERSRYAAAAFKAYGSGQPQTAQAPPASQPVAPPGAPMVLPSAPIFPQAAQIGADQMGPAQAGYLTGRQPQQAAQADPSYFAQIPAEQAMQAPPIHFAQRRPVNMTALRNALQQRAPYFSKG